MQTIDPSLLLHIDKGYLSSQIIERINLSSKAVDLSRIFGGKKLRPDAVVMRSISNQIQTDETYLIHENEFNDYGYLTRISGIDARTKIAYIGQEVRKHSFQKLKNSSYFMKVGDGILIDERLPDIYYSFWEITEKIDNDCLSKMKFFNHLFYLALEKNIFDWDSFVHKILDPLKVKFCIKYGSSFSNIFTNSLLRDYCMIKSYEHGEWWGKYKKKQLINQFSEFVTNVQSEFKNYFEIVDIKYLNSEFFHNPNNIEEIKQKSVRKQFVYEHLLQKEVEKRKDQYSNLRIQSSFWLPSDRPNDPNLLQDSEKPFMDNYIHLKNVNFSILAENYIASASSEY